MKVKIKRFRYNNSSLLEKQIFTEKKELYFDNKVDIFLNSDQHKIRLTDK